jgi:cytochrome c-type biogenesis protein
MDNNENVVVLAVHIAGEEDRIKKFIDDKGYTFPVLLDRTADVSTAFMVSGTPTTYFISPEGIFYGGVPGYMESDYLNDLVDQFKPE